MKWHVHKVRLNERDPMTTMEELNEYLDSCGVFFFSTISEEGPVTRPLGFKMVVDGQLYFGIGTFKSAYKQLVADPRVYLCALKQDGSGWVRVSGKAVCDSDPALVDACFAAAPDLKGVYEANGWEMGIFHLENGAITYVEGPMTPVKTVEF